MEKIAVRDILLMVHNLVCTVEPPGELSELHPDPVPGDPDATVLISGLMLLEL